MGVIGHPIGHSLSPRMHNAAFAAGGMEYVYLPLDVKPKQLPAAVEGAVAFGFRGLNVTMPHKEKIVPLLDAVGEASRISGAVNTVVIEEDSSQGHNTDGGGFVEACRAGGVKLTGRRVLIVGAGGAAAAIAFALIGEGAAQIRIDNRTAARAERLRDRLLSSRPEAQISAGSLEDIEEDAAGAEVIINATYLGMKDEDPLPVPMEYLDAGKVVCDVVYRAGRGTRLVQVAGELGARVVSGDRMLLYQGVQAQRLWTGREPDVEAMNNALT